MKKNFKIIMLVFLSIIVSSGCFFVTAFADNVENNNEKITYDDVLNNLDLSKLEQLISDIGNGEVYLDDANTLIKKTIEGEVAVDFSFILEMFFLILSKRITSYLPFLLTLFSIIIVLSILSGVNSESMSSSIETIISFTGNILISALILCQTYYLFFEILRFSERILSISEIVFPILFTIMSTIGASQSVAIYTPSVAIFTNCIIGLASKIIVPLIIISLVIAIVGNISNSLQLNNFHGLIVGFAEWILKTSFFVFSAVLTLQGIFVSVSDGVAQRMSKFALSKYVPVIGGYLSDGFNFLIGSSIIVKNAIGITSILLLIAEFIPIFIEITIAIFSLKIASSLAEPLGLSRTGVLLNRISKSMSTANGVVCGISFVFIIFIALIMLSANTVV